MADLIKTSNPALNQKIFEGAQVAPGEAMTLDGTVNKTGVLLALALAAASWPWHLFLQTHSAASVSGTLFVGVFGGFIIAMITIFKMTWAPVTAPVYALLEGLALGSISAVLEMRYPGIAMQAVAMTFGTLLVMLVLYRTGIIPVTQKLRIGIVAATGAVCLFYLAQLILGFFGVQFSSVNGSGMVGIAFSVVVVGIAALNLVLDFDFIESGVKANAPKYMEWYGAFGIMVTLVWLYLEILRLLSKMRSRN
jgi:uncharacterized YccA/Bax inhibitor family protein